MRVSNLTLLIVNLLFEISLQNKKQKMRVGDFSGKLLLFVLIFN
jgi:hypothetical protein